MADTHEHFRAGWPATPPREGEVILRESTPADVPLAIELSTDPYVPLGQLPSSLQANYGLLVTDDGVPALGSTEVPTLTQAGTDTDPAGTTWKVGAIVLHYRFWPDVAETSAYILNVGERGNAATPASLTVLPPLLNDGASLTAATVMVKVTLGD